MRETGTAALGRFVLRGQEHFGLIRARGEALVLETLFLAEDVRSQAEIEEAVEESAVKDAELDACPAGDRQPRCRLRSGLPRERLPTRPRAMLEAKLAGEEISRPEPEPETPVVDLMEALRRSVAEVQEQKPASSRKAPAKKKTAARPKAKAAARKSLARGASSMLRWAVRPAL